MNIPSEELEIQIVSALLRQRRWRACKSIAQRLLSADGPLNRDQLDELNQSTGTEPSRNLVTLLGTRTLIIPGSPISGNLGPEEIRPETDIVGSLGDDGHRLSHPSPSRSSSGSGLGSVSGPASSAVRHQLRQSFVISSILDVNNAPRLFDAFYLKDFNALAAVLDRPLLPSPATSATRAAFLNAPASASPKFGGGSNDGCFQPSTVNHQPPTDRGGTGPTLGNTPGRRSCPLTAPPLAVPVEPTNPTVPGSGFNWVRSAYLLLAALVHPDKCALPFAVEAFQILQRAYEIQIKTAELESGSQKEGCCKESKRDFGNNLWQRRVVEELLRKRKFRENGGRFGGSQFGGSQFAGTGGLQFGTQKGCGGMFTNSAETPTEANGDPGESTRRPLNFTSSRVFFCPQGDEPESGFSFGSSRSYTNTYGYGYDDDDDGNSSEGGSGHHIDPCYGYGGYACGDGRRGNGDVDGGDVGEGKGFGFCGGAQGVPEDSANFTSFDCPGAQRQKRPRRGSFPFGGSSGVGVDVGGDGIDGVGGDCEKDSRKLMTSEERHAFENTMGMEELRTALQKAQRDILYCSSPIIIPDSPASSSSRQIRTPKPGTPPGFGSGSDDPEALDPDHPPLARREGTPLSRLQRQRRYFAIRDIYTRRLQRSTPMNPKSRDAMDSPTSDPFVLDPPALDPRALETKGGKMEEDLRFGHGLEDRRGSGYRSSYGPGGGFGDSCGGGGFVV